MAGTTGGTPRNTRRAIGKPVPVEDIRRFLKAERATMPPGTARIADFILEQPRDIIGMSLTEFAQTVTVSESMVLKVMRQIGLSGFQALKMTLVQSTGSGTEIIQEDLEKGDDARAVIDKVFRANGQALQDTHRLLDPALLQQAVDIILAASDIELYGVGSAAPIAEDAHYRMMRIGLRTRVTLDSHLQAVSAVLATPQTVVITISHSGSTMETLSATRMAKEAGAKVVVITGHKLSPLQKVADVVLQTVARETTFRTEAMASRIAQLSIVDALIALLALSRHDESVETLRTTFTAISSKRS